MTVVPHLIARYALALYALSALGAFFYIWTAILSRRREGLALFTMEREDAVKQSRRSWRMAGVCVLIAAGVYGVSNYVAPNLPLDSSKETSVADILITPSAEPTPIPAANSTPVLTSTATVGPLPTVAPIPTPLSRPPDTPTPPPAGAGGGPPVDAACTGAGTQITFPSNGELVSGVVELRGTASLPDFAFYKFEIQWPGSEEWITLQSFDAPVAGGILGYWDTTPFEPGTYRFRLVVVDSTYNYPEPCAITVIVEPPPSP